MNPGPNIFRNHTFQSFLDGVDERNEDSASHGGRANFGEGKRGHVTRLDAADVKGSHVEARRILYFA